MDTSEALRALGKSGRSSEAGKLINEAAARAASGYEAIRQDRSRTDEYKRSLLAENYRRHRRAVDVELVKLASTAVTTDRDDAERVFGIKGLAGDPASLAISRRDAADRVASITDTKELRALLARATRQGDEVLAHAIAERAVDSLDDKTLHQFLADRPALDAAVERLWNTKRAEDNHSMAGTLSLVALRPTELMGVTADEIDRLASANVAS